MKIILVSDYNGLGKAGDLIDVKPGFARNRLLPKGLALRASKKNIALIEEKKRVIKNSKKSLIILNNIKFSFDKKDRKLYKYKNKGPLDSHWF